MFLIRNWISNNQKTNDISKIIELGLKLVSDQSDKYVPKSSDYKMLATPLPHIKDKNKAYELITKIEKYATSIETNSSTIDLLSIKLLIARTLCEFDFDKGENKLLDIYDDIEKLSDNQQKAIKCNCFAIYANEATKIANKHQDMNLDLYLDTAREGINNNIDEILKQTASHFEIVHSIITNLIRLYPDDAIGICQKLNKSIDRDNAFLECLATYLKQNFEKIDTEIVDRLLDSILDLDIKKIAISEIINRVQGERDMAKELASRFYKYFNKVDNLVDNRAKCILFVKIISILEQNDQDYSAYYKKLKQTWIELEKSVYKIELGFEIAYNAAFLKSKDIAKEILQAAKDEKDKPDFLLDSPNTAEIFSSVIELTIRVFSGLIFSNNYQEKDIEDIEKIINSLPSQRQKMKLWASLILRIVPKSKDDKLPKQLINLYIIPKLSKIKNKNERIDTILELIVVLYLNDKNLPYLDELPNQKLKDIALSRICNYLSTKCLPDEPCDDNGQGYTIDHETVEEILELTKLMKNDYFIADQIIDIRKSIFSKNTRISSQKKIDIKDEFEKIAKIKLPDKNNIKHLGYQLLVRANALSIQSKQKWEDWNSILKNVEDIPNLSDRIFMWISIAELLPNEYMKQKKELILKAIESTYKLPSYLDTVERIQMVFFTLYKKGITGVRLKPLLEKFIKAINTNSNSPYLRENYKNIIDVAHSVDPTIAKTIVNSFDKDEARLNTGAYLDNHFNLLEFQSRLDRSLNQNENEKTILENNPNFFNKIIDKKLAHLNASKINGDSLSPKDLVYQLKIASQYSVFESYNSFSYFIERLVIKYEDTDEAKKLLRNSFLELLEVCDLIKLLSVRNADKIKTLLDLISVNDENDLTRNIDDESIDIIYSLLKKGKTVHEISNFLEIDIETVKSFDT